jgi:hypothetical protein
MAKKTDQKTLALIEEVKNRKEEISKLSRPNWKTNCSFTYDENKMNDCINLHVESNVRKLISYAAFLRLKESSYFAAIAELKLSDYPEFTWCGFSVPDWMEDIKTRINQVQINSKEKSLEVLEARLNTIVSPELKAQMELEAIEKELL